MPRSTRLTGKAIKSAKPRRGIINLWVPYARKHPERLVAESGA